MAGEHAGNVRNVPGLRISPDPDDPGSPQWTSGVSEDADALEKCGNMWKNVGFHMDTYLIPPKIATHGDFQHKW